MEWIAVFTFGLVAALALTLGREARAFAPLGVQAVAAVGGLSLCIVFIALGGSTGVAWGAFAAAVVGLVAATSGVAWLTSDRHVVGGAAAQHREETDAMVAGLELPLFGLAAAVSLLTALSVVTLN